MDQSSIPSREYESLKATTLLPLLSAYFIAVGALYLWGFWGSFGVNILEYLGLTDVVKVAAWPVGSAFVFLIIGMVMGEIGPGARLKLPEGGGRHTPFGIWLNKHRHSLAFALMVFLVTLVTFGPPQMWQLVAMFGGIFLSLPLRRHPILVKLIPNDSIRSALALAAVVLPVYAFGQGRVNADEIRSGHRYFYVLSGSEGISSTGDMQTSMRYVGYAGGTYFFWEPSLNGVTLVPASAVQSLKLARLPRENRSLWNRLTSRD